MTKKIYLVALLFLTSCVKYYYTKEGGERVYNPKVFKYNKPKYTRLDKSLVDTNAVYVLDSVYAPWPGNYGSFHHTLVRFFSTGQVLFITYDSVPTVAMVNNKDAGTPGYFIIEGDKLKIARFEITLGAHILEYYGRIQGNGDIIFYEQSPKTVGKSFKKLEKYGVISFWKKRIVEGMQSYKPGW